MNSYHHQPSQQAQQHHATMDGHHSYMTNGHPPAPMAQYSYAPSTMQPTLGYAAPYHYGYPTHAVASGGHHAYSHHGMTLPAMPSSAAPGQPLQDYARPMDTTGQIPPPGHKPKLTGTVWEDEGTICFQVEVNGICVARREDNCFINGTKLLNVANMTRGRRDGILKSEKERNVVKIGPMHLKGVWIPFQRALEFANKEKITEQLYPLFVHNIGPLLTPHMQSNLPMGNRRSESTGQPSSLTTPTQQQRPATTQGTQPTLNTQGLHSSGSTRASTQQLGRPNLDRAHTFPTPPTSASSVIGGLPTTASNYDWTPAVNASQPLALDQTNATRSMPTTPTTTPPDSGIHSMQYPTSSSFDNARGVYPTPTQQQSGSQYGTTSYHPNMPPPGRVNDLKDDSDEPRDFGSSAVSYADTHAYGYTGNSSNDTSPNNSANATATGKTSPKNSASGHATPRSLESPATQWPSSYATPQRSQTLPQTGLAYATPASNTPQYPYTASSLGNKRGRDDEDDDPYVRPNSQTGTNVAIKRQKAVHEDSHPLSVTPRTAIAQRQ